jgi:hypothetical protein
MQKEKELLVLPAIHNIEEVIKGLSRPIKLTKGLFSNLEFRFKDGAVSLILSGVDIKNFSYIWLSSYWESRDLAYAVKLYLKHFKRKYTYVEKSTSKVTDQVVFALNNISAPNTFFIDDEDISKYIKTIENICGYPLIIKDITGAGGKLSVYIKNRKELSEQTVTLPKHKKYLFQKFIPNDYDWGVLVSNSKVVSAEKSYPSCGEFRNNCHGATEVFSKIRLIPKPVRDMAVKAAKVLGLSWSRSDIVIDKETGTAYLMEVNRCPGISSGTKEVGGAQSFLEAYLK